MPKNKKIKQKKQNKTNKKLGQILIRQQFCKFRNIKLF